MNNIYNVSEKLFQLNDFSKKTRQDLHKIPELSGEEYKTSKYCRELMEKYNLNQDELEKFIYQKAKIGLNSCRAFNHGSNGFMRINTACPRSVLERALKQLETACNELESK